MLEQRTLQIDGNIIYCYSDGSVEWYTRRTSDNTVFKRRTFGFSRNKKGYLGVEIGSKTYAVHRLIALAFHNKSDNLLEVDHINRNTQDNRPSNLRWVSKKINQANRSVVDASIEKYGFRYCENKKAYMAAYEVVYNKYRLTIHKPDGSHSMTSRLSNEELRILKPLSCKDRYFAYQDILLKRKETA